MCTLPSAVIAMHIYNYRKDVTVDNPTYFDIISYSKLLKITQKNSILKYGTPFVERPLYKTNCSLQIKNKKIMKISENFRGRKIFLVHRDIPNITPTAA